MQLLQIKLHPQILLWEWRWAKQNLKFIKIEFGEYSLLFSLVLISFKSEEYRREKSASDYHGETGEK